MIGVKRVALFYTTHVWPAIAPGTKLTLRQQHTENVVHRTIQSSDVNHCAQNTYFLARAC